MLVYKSEEIAVRELEKSDELLLVAWLSNSSVLQYYEGRDRPHDLEMVRESFYVDDDESRCIIEYNGKPIGYIQFYLLDEETRADYGYLETNEKIYGMDQFIGEIEYWNKGIGKKLVKSMVEYLVNHEGADKIVMDPQAWNLRALTCYERCGFKKIKVLKEHEEHEGELRDCWLIEYSRSN
ncbi:GNAT family N-acetyltransferase [Paenibacillus sp. DMB20]|uniref:GNAT family N-acetyltransferase n=1 Tax=Paenibacillus sp. DMB20 TaxID=1642570 RepID=UPI0006275EEB|nr:GNAT family N-acetyltransferase [Paenibacillus sp. DMB20]KKO51727.1 2-aminoglycoside phosphotransferase [Paenibacillus sp. DMB20]